MAHALEGSDDAHLPTLRWAACIVSSHRYGHISSESGLCFHGMTGSCSLQAEGSGAAEQQPQPCQAVGLRPRTQVMGTAGYQGVGFNSGNKP